MLSTKDTLEMGTVERTSKDGEVLSSTQKPLAVLEYNKSKQGIDLSDQMSDYYTTLRKTAKWYKNVAYEYMLGISITNSLLLYKDIKGIHWKNIKPSDFYTMLKFWESIIRSLVGIAPPVRLSRNT